MGSEKREQKVYPPLKGIVRTAIFLCFYVFLCFCMLLYYSNKRDEGTIGFVAALLETEDLLYAC